MKLTLVANVLFACGDSSHSQDVEMTACEICNGSHGYNLQPCPNQSQSPSLPNFGASPIYMNL